jgi:hypothetical protein
MVKIIMRMIFPSSKPKPEAKQQGQSQVIDARQAQSPASPAPNTVEKTHQL